MIDLIYLQLIEPIRCKSIDLVSNGMRPMTNPILNKKNVWSSSQAVANAYASQSETHNRINCLMSV